MIAFRVDSSFEIGTGHVMRCLTLAEELRSLGLSSIFLCKAHSGAVISLIECKGFVVKQIEDSPMQRSNDFAWCPHSRWLGASWQSDISATIKLLPRETKVVVVDHYSLDFRWEKKLLSELPKVRILVIDDLADRKHCCHVLLDQTFRRPKSDYVGLVPSSATTLIGSDYALLRGEFREFRRLGLQSKRSRNTPCILVNLGGSDEGNETLNLLNAIDAIYGMPDFTLKVIVGASYKYYESLNTLIPKLKRRAELFSTIENMAEVISTVDLAIGAGGVSAIERCCLGVPSLILPIAKNQELVTRNLCSAGAAAYLANSSTSEVRSLLRCHLLNQGKLGEMSLSAAAVTDGKGAGRVTKIIRRLHSDQ